MASLLCPEESGLHVLSARLNLRLTVGQVDLNFITMYEIRMSSHSGFLQEEQITWNWSLVLKTTVLFCSQDVALPFLFAHSRNAIGSS